MIKFDHRVIKGAFVLCACVLLLGMLNGYLLALIMMMVMILHLLFFRVPSQNPPSGNYVLGPAYGHISDIEIVQETRFIQGEAVKIGIFLSLFDPHIQLCPLDAQVAYQEYVPGKFLNALRRDSSLKNESNWIGFESGQKKVVVRQITGAIARRIFWDVRIGGKIPRGKKIGVICYGSRVECYVPAQGFKVMAKVGDYVSGSHTILGEWQ